MDREPLRITGLTGVEVELEIAGAGSRSYAFIIDWHIRLLAALAWFFVALTLYTRSGGSHGARAFATITGIPAACIYFFYHPILEVLLHGRTPGKRMAGVRIVTLNGGTPSIGALLIRNVFRLIDSLPALYLVGLLCCLVTAQRVRIGDMAAGTLLVREESASAKSLSALGGLVAQSGLAADVVELIDDLLQRWHALDISRRTTLARMILARVDRSTAPETLTAMSDSELRQRLQSLLAGVQPPAA